MGHRKNYEIEVENEILRYKKRNSRAENKYNVLHRSKEWLEKEEWVGRQKDQMLE